MSSVKVFQGRLSAKLFMQTSELAFSDLSRAS
jgi:hypothetical protein